MKEKVSIIMPCYNGEKTISNSIQSIYTQDYNNIELIVVDDGSLDNSKYIIQSWIKKYENKGLVLKYYHQENKGPASAVNAGLKLVTGDYISLLDADDEYLDGIISERVSYLQNHPDVSIVRTNGYIINGKNKWLFISEEKEKQLTDVFSALLSWKTNNWAGSFMVRSKDLFEFYPDRNIYESWGGQNLQLMLPLLYKRKCGFIDKPHMNYNKQECSLTETSNDALKKALALKNGELYTEIRIYMVKLIVKDENEREKYLSIIDSAKWRYFINVAIMYKDKELLKKSKLGLIENDDYLLDDRIEYYKLISPLVSNVLRGVRKTRNMIKG